VQTPRSATRSRLSDALQRARCLADDAAQRFPINDPIGFSVPTTSGLANSSLTSASYQRPPTELAHCHPDGPLARTQVSPLQAKCRSSRWWALLIFARFDHLPVGGMPVVTDCHRGEEEEKGFSLASTLSCQASIVS